MIPSDITNIMILMVAFTTAFGLPYGVAGSLQSGKMQHLRSEENAIRYVAVLVVAVFGVVAIWPLVHHLEVPLNTIIAVVVSGICSILSWKMFSKGIKRGEELFGYDLKTTFEAISGALQSLTDASAELRAEHKEDSKTIRNAVEDLVQKLSLDQKIQDFASKAAQKEAEWAVNDHISRIYDYGKELLAKITQSNKDLVSKVEELLAQNKKQDDTSSGKLLSSATIETAAPVQVQPQPSSMQKSQKVLGMLSMDFSRYKPKAHKLCIAIYGLLKNRQNTLSSQPEQQQYRPNLSEISGISGVNKTDVKSRLQELVNLGLVIMQKGRSSRIEFGFSEKLDRIFNPVLKNQREGGMESFYLIQRAKHRYLDQEHYFETLRQDISIEQPDAIAVPILDNESFSVTSSVAIEVETPQEVRAHPEQVKSNMVKNMEWFSRIQVWCYAESRDAIQKILDSLEIEQKDIKIDIMSVQNDGTQA